MRTVQLLGAGLLACATSAFTCADVAQERNLRAAEAFIDAFYAFDAAALQPFLDSAAASAPAILYYQGWAEGGNYKIVKRQPCAVASANSVRCSVTVEDDPMLALNIDFNVTDTFTITFDATRIVSVETSSNDQQIYFDAQEWVKKEMPEVMSGPCKGFFSGGPTPGDCARAMTEGYRKFAASDAYPRPK